MPRRGDGEDLTSETFLAAVRNLDEGRPAPLDVPWVIGVARHKLADHWRRRAREDRLQDALEQEHEPKDDPWDVHLDQLRASEVLTPLGPHHRLALTLRYVDGLPVAEVADLPYAERDRGIARASTEGGPSGVRGRRRP